MEPTLVAVTLLSLAMAVAMGAIAWRLLREERRRSEARVAALAELANPRNARGMPTEDPRKDHGTSHGRSHGRSEERSGALGSPRATSQAECTGSPPSQEKTAPTWDALPQRPPVPDAGAPAPGDAARGLFAAAAPPSRLGARVSALAAAALVMAAGVWGVWQLGAPANGGAAAAAAAPIELLSLAHDREGDTLRITGLVQNPKSGREQRDVVAVAFLFDRSGRVVASGSAPIDSAQLAPGDESPFVIVVGHAGTVARYRLGFRARDGRVLAHVDRRGDAAASGEPPTASTGELAARGGHPESD